MKSKRILFFAICVLSMILILLFSQPMEKAQNIMRQVQTTRILNSLVSNGNKSSQSPQVVPVNLQELRKLVSTNQSQAQVANLTAQLEPLQQMLNARLQTSGGGGAGNVETQHGKLVSGKDSANIADELYHRVRVLCYIPCAEKSIQHLAKAVMETWTRRCNKIILFTKYPHKDLPAVGLRFKDSGSMALTRKMYAGMKYLYEHHVDDFDWFLKADVDTYVIMENLRYMLSEHDPSQPVYFGHHFVAMLEEGYMSGGAGYVMSRETLSRFGRQPCTQSDGVEDFDIGRCLLKLGVRAGDSRDKHGNSRFHCMDAETHVNGFYPDWYFEYDKYKGKHGIDSMSDYAISFHFLKPSLIYTLEYYIYHLRPYGIISKEIMDANAHQVAKADASAHQNGTAAPEEKAKPKFPIRKYQKKEKRVNSNVKPKYTKDTKDTKNKKEWLQMRMTTVGQEKESEEDKESLVLKRSTVVNKNLEYTEQ